MTASPFELIRYPPVELTYPTLEKRKIILQKCLGPLGWDLLVPRRVDSWWDFTVYDPIQSVWLAKVYQVLLLLGFVSIPNENSIMSAWHRVTKICGVQVSSRSTMLVRNVLAKNPAFGTWNHILHVFPGSKCVEKESEVDSQTWWYVWTEGNCIRDFSNERACQCIIYGLICKYSWNNIQTKSVWSKSTEARESWTKCLKLLWSWESWPTWMSQENSRWLVSGL